MFTIRKEELLLKSGTQAREANKRKDQSPVTKMRCPSASVMGSLLCTFNNDIPYYFGTSCFKHTADIPLWNMFVNINTWRALDPGRAGEILHTRSNFVLECQQKTTSIRQRSIYLQHLLCIQFLNMYLCIAQQCTVQSR